MNDTNSKYNDLIAQIHSNFIFYISKSNFTNEEFENLPEESKSLLNKIIYFDADDLVPIYDNSLALLNLMSKPTLLKRNCFKLIDYKEALNESSFNYLAENYFNELTVFVSISNELYLDFEKKSPILDDNVKAMFNLQNINFKNHLEEVQKITGFSTPILNEQNFIHDLKIDKTRRWFPFEIKTNKKDLNILSENSDENINLSFSENANPLSEFIIHQCKEEIEKVIKQQFSHLRGITLRYLIDFLKEEGILLIPNGKNLKLLNGFKELFEGKDVGKYQSVFQSDYTKNDKKYLDAKVIFEKFFKPFLKTK